MSWSYIMMQVFDIVLRVPPLFVMDSILNQTFLHTWVPENMLASHTTFLAWIIFEMICKCDNITVMHLFKLKFCTKKTNTVNNHKLLSIALSHTLSQATSPYRKIWKLGVSYPFNDLFI